MRGTVELRNIEKSFGVSRVLKGVNLSIAEREQCVIQGASGSGKSTLLHLLGGLDRPQNGEIKVGGEDLLSMDDESLAYYRNRCVGMIFQFHFLLPSMTNWNNVLLPGRIGRVGLKEVKDRCRSLAEQLGVSHCLERYPFEISGGEQQRINIIRALSLKPDLLLCDEPTGNLDSQNSLKVTRLLQKLSQDNGTTLIVVTHDQKVASHFSRVCFLQDGIFERGEIGRV